MERIQTLGKASMASVRIPISIGATNYLEEEKERGKMKDMSVKK